MVLHFKATTSDFLSLSHRAVMSTSNFAIHNNSLKANPTVRPSIHPSNACSQWKSHSHTIKGSQSSTTHTESAHRHIYNILGDATDWKRATNAPRRLRIKFILIVIWRCRFNNNSNSAQHKSFSVLCLSECVTRRVCTAPTINPAPSKLRLNYLAICFSSGINQRLIISWHAQSDTLAQIQTTCCSSSCVKRLCIVLVRVINGAGKLSLPRWSLYLLIFIARRAERMDGLLIGIHNTQLIHSVSYIPGKSNFCSASLCVHYF